MDLIEEDGLKAEVEERVIGLRLGRVVVVVKVMK